MKQSIHGLYAIADNTFRLECSHTELAEEFLKGGCQLIQLRSKIKNKKSKILEETCKIMGFKKQYPFTFIVNDFVEIALEVGADGVHVGQDDLPIEEVRKKVGNKMLIGYSSHSLEEALKAQKRGADYVAFGAIFPTKTKAPGHPVQGLEKLGQVVKKLSIPVVAIGGINKNNFRQVKETGVAAIAMISALTESKNIAAETQFFVSHF
ncbi:MAG: thiamine-phosphate diphosphorylase [Deltaproteobacteria bacterium RIFCSPLOWO2_01_44_7]|nr:MAG: thiamine-phosphate diphosphorylase [Deltaproteobacteria bacterium RIFCSPHIGHO2_01_FULL_43_49]OGQ14547.1 MAG: thiamine-phosphate diphosphorylase [Deltaproteobacteria bacterium RIFCSPHIGHO2_02_FULL_44_53]OGQ27933.1 MAG: thiamine-phosphate diphosphorylase [Deltaproteobacteria bacterium RIFCSPHIGHO2_12_FULL_44_21]OGQ31145.1 MAG: thiamine-phosphate diphosphorylase [Deltaproteobacteria bacterium RIFCSPLOWO2_01_FULL_45_74]OGQ37567.1 MAG: thiamine-phosphate diphosphorylase [Deltaproteobacteria 